MFSINIKFWTNKQNNFTAIQDANYWLSTADRGVCVDAIKISMFMIINKNRYPGWCGGSLNIVDVGLIYKNRF